ncbi:cytochrome P450 315a1, mitochondrial [Trichoplusia ni]|uniref:Cytochrome P450 315a1, mitochondrial n=1 Tax=Trichoplusia ni TaxID=7111 RepID=A0A7E5W3A6_TRINI|nr:cytochrome P450 315a1, mitochondrial [Trichoplusia ni]
MYLTKNLSVLKFPRKTPRFLSISSKKLALTIHDIPRPKGLPLIGTKLEFIAAGSGTKIHEYVDNRHKQLGPIFCEKLGGSTDLVFVSDPMLIKVLFLSLEGKYPVHILPEPWVLYEKLYGSKRGLFFMNGNEWLQNRRIMNKHLLREGSEKLFEIPVKTTVQKFVQRWKVEANKSEFVPHLESEFYRLSIDVIMAVLLGNNPQLNTDKHYDTLLTTFSEAVKRIFQTTTKLYGIPVNICQKLDLKVWRDFKESVDVSLSLAHKLVTEIMQGEKSNGLINILREENMKDEIVKKIIGDFVIAAGDTTAYTTLWSLLLLSRNENAVKDLIFNENTSGTNVIKEAMRLYPVAPFLTRILPKDCVLGSYTFNKGTPIIASIYTSGRDEQNFSRAKEFLPYRWDRNDPRKKDLLNHVSSASLPFALGARSCIGKKLAMLQLTEVVTQVTKNFKYACINKDEIHANTSQVLVPDRDIKLVFSLREHKSTTACD